ncbi:MAG: ribokinase [Candidatus Eisenbacteria sp.]|nr:ribokinase [Candidatus Eisenbacteria bacterium]
MDRIFDVVGVGYTAYDYLAIVPHMPEPDTKMEMADLLEQGGGPVSTALVTLARLGRKTAVIAKVGGDVRGRLMLEDLQREGVDTRGVIVSRDHRSQFAFILVEPEKGHRTILWSRAGLPNLTEGEIDYNLVRSARLLHVDNHEIAGAIAAARIAKEEGIPVLVDAGTPDDRIEELLSLVDYAVTSHSFPEKLTGIGNREKALEAIRAYGPKVAVTTMGPEGALALTDDGFLHSPGFKVDVVDTTGAGDVFHGAFACAVLEGWELEGILRFSNAVAAMKCRSLGGRTGIPTRSETDEFLAVSQ